MIYIGSITNNTFIMNNKNIKNAEKIVVLTKGSKKN